MHFWYKFLTYLFYPLANFFLLLRKFNGKEHSERYKEKLSKINIIRDKGFLVWIHFASVGEGLSILPLINSLEKDENVKRILITSITLSSSDVLQKKLRTNKKVIHQFLPLDIPIYVKKFLTHWSPNLSIFIDSEIWPNLIYETNARKIPLLLINGRITKKSFLRWKYVSSYAKKIFEKFDLCLAASKESENHLINLGAKNVKNFGNLKFAVKEFNAINNLDKSFLNKIKNRKIWCAASTHDPEEFFSAKVHSLIKKKTNILTIIIPRHVHRVKDIYKKLLNLDLKVSFYTKLSELNVDTDILLVDTYGETSKFFNISRSVFLGGSLVKHGGQNPIEPARLGCKIFHGPNISNFTEIYDYLKSLEVSNKIDNIEELSEYLIKEFNSGTSRNNEIITKIDSYGLNIMNNVMKEIKIYINN